MRRLQAIDASSRYRRAPSGSNFYFLADELRPLCGLYAIQLRHRNIHDNNIGLKSLPSAKLFCRYQLADNIHVRLALTNDFNPSRITM